MTTTARPPSTPATVSAELVESLLTKSLIVRRGVASVGADEVSPGEFAAMFRAGLLRQVCQMHGLTEYRLSPEGRRWAEEAAGGE